MLVVMSVALMLLAATLSFEQYISIHQVRLLRHLMPPGSNRLLDACAHRFVLADADRLEMRLRFLLERFDVPRTMRFHFVQMSRQLLLTIVAFLGSFYAGSGGVFVEAGCSIAVILFYLAIQFKVKPFYFILHNQLEQFLGA